MAKMIFKEVHDYVSKTHDKLFNNGMKDLQKKRPFKIIGELAPGPSYYKYFPLENAIKCLEGGTIAFVEPSRWNDAYESLYYEANYSLVTTDYAFHPRVLATCATNKKYDEPAWRIYSGEDNICVQFEINRPKFRMALLNALEDGDSIYEGKVQYSKKYIIENIGYQTTKNVKTGLPTINKLYDDFTMHGGSFGIDNYFNLLLLKRKDFEHEQETRFFIVKKSDIMKKSEKTEESHNETSDATKRVVTVTRGGLEVLTGINWADILKGVTINADENTLHYKYLYDSIKKMIKVNVKDASKHADYEQRLKPAPYLVYGTKPGTITIGSSKP